MFYKGDSVYLYIVDFGSEFNGFDFLASDNGEGNAGRYSRYGWTLFCLQINSSLAQGLSV